MSCPDFRQIIYNMKKIVLSTASNVTSFGMKEVNMFYIHIIAFGLKLEPNVH